MVHPAELSPGRAIRSTRFELVGPSGQTVAVWGQDDFRNTVLTFQDERSHAVAKFGVHNSGSDKSPFLAFTASDGKPRVNIQLAEPMERPSIVLGDEHWEGRVMLGFIPTDYPSPEDSEWGITFMHPNVASIGVWRDPKDGSLGGNLFISDGRGHSLHYPRNP